jgi:hypothetical protein
MITTRGTDMLKTIKKYIAKHKQIKWHKSAEFKEMHAQHKEGLRIIKKIREVLERQAFAGYLTHAKLPCGGHQYNWWNYKKVLGFSISKTEFVIYGPIQPGKLVGFKCTSVIQAIDERPMEYPNIDTRAKLEIYKMCARLCK